MEDYDLSVYDNAHKAAFSIYLRLRKAIMKPDAAAVIALQPKMEEAKKKLEDAQVKLIIEEGIICTEEDVKEMEAIRKEIDAAADTQQVIEGAIKLAAFLAKFIV